MAENNVGIAGRFRVAVDAEELKKRGLADYAPDDLRRKTTLQTKPDGFIDGMEAANGFSGTFVRGGAAALAEAVGAGLVIDYQALDAITVNPLNERPRVTFAQNIAEQLTSEFPTAALMGHFGPGFAWIADAPLTVEAKEIFAGRQSLERVESFVDSRVKGTRIGAAFDDLAENDRTMASTYAGTLMRSPDQRPNRAFSVKITAQHPSGEMRHFEGVVHGIVGKEIGGEPSIVLWHNAMRRGLVAQEPADQTDVKPSALGISPGKERQLRARVSDMFDDTMDYRFDGKSFVENVKPTSISARFLTKASSQKELDSELTFLAWNRVVHFGLRRDAEHWVRQEQIRIKPIDFETAAGKTHTVQFDVVDPNDEKRILGSGKLELAAEKSAEHSGLALMLKGVTVDPGSLHRVSVGFPGDSFSAQFVGGSIERAEKALILEEMAARGLLV